MTSKIKVDNINKVSDDSNIINKCGSTTTVGSGSGNTIVVCGSTVTMGRCGGTVALASGATQTGFGRTGTVDWQTSSIKTTTFTAANGEGYFADTSSGGFTMNLPAGTAGNIVSVVDYTNTFQTGNLTVVPNGSQKIGGVAASFTANTEGQSLTWVYVDDTEGWKNTMDSTSNATGNAFMVATGGTETTSGNCKIHTFTGPGTFAVSSIAVNCAANNVVSYMVVGGGGGAGSGLSGGAGAGGFREVKSPVTPYTASPLDGYPSSPNRITVTAASFPITVGAGGAANGTDGGVGVQGSTSQFSTIIGAGGGYGSGYGNTGGPGGSGGGGGGNSTYAGGSGNTPPTTPPQGQSGGQGTGNPPGRAGGGGGGAGQLGGDSPTSSKFGNGGNGVATAINPAQGTPGSSPINPSPSPNPYFAGGGGGNGDQASNSCNAASGRGGVGGGGNGRESGSCATAGTANTGGGGGGGGSGSNNGAAGGSGIVIIRYKFQ